MNWRIAIAIGAACVCGGFGGCASTNQNAPSLSVETVKPLGHVVQEPPLRLAPYGSNPKKERPDVVISLVRDEASQEVTIVVKGMSLGLSDLKDWLYPIARSAIDAKTKFSEVGVVIRCDRDVPFEHVQRVMQTCAHRDIMMPTISLAVESRLATPLPADQPLPADPEEWEKKEARHRNRIRIALMMRNDACVCFVDGRSVGVLPDAKPRMVARLKALKAKGRTLVEIDPRKVTHRHVIDAIECCRRAKLKDLSFTSALPSIENQIIRKKDAKPGK